MLSRALLHLLHLADGRSPRISEMLPIVLPFAVSVENVCGESSPLFRLDRAMFFSSVFLLAPMLSTPYPSMYR